MTLRPMPARHYFDEEGNIWYYVPPSAIGNEYFYTPETDKLWQPVLREVPPEDFNDFGSDRFKELKNLGKRHAAMSKVSDSDLKKLGYLK